MANHAAASISELMQVEFAQQDCASRFQAANYFGVCGWNVIFQYRAGGSGFYTGGFNQVFYSERNSMQWAFPLSAGNLRFSFAGRFQCCVARYGNKSV